MAASIPTPLFNTQIPPIFKWADMPFFIRDYYNYMMGIVFSKDRTLMKNVDFKYYNSSLCLAFDNFIYSENQDSFCQALEKLDNPYQEGCSPVFQYVRPSINIKDVTSNYTLNQLGMGAVIWLYYYERMGIFKILGALLDDYNYKGKYTLKIKEPYAVLMEHVSLLFRKGEATTSRDRCGLFEKTIGATIENNFGMVVTKNESFMKTFDEILKQALEHYSYRRLDNAIGSATGAARSSVATLTTIKDSLENLKSQFQPFYYGRNAINTFLGIVTVYATLCLVRLMKSDIGISNQYEKPQDFIPAAYDILVMGKPAVITDSNRFITYDNCASYGYRLLTDFELINTTLFNPSSNVDDPLNLWINSIEPLVEGYKKAVASVKD
jgi:hypothetical protein